MFHSAKILRNRNNIFFGNLSPDCADGSKVIFYVVDTWDADFVHVEHWGNTVTVIHGKSTIFCKVTAQCRGNSAAKLASLAPRISGRKGSSDFIIRIDNSAADTTLMQIDVAFCIDIFLHILVDIQMVWAQRW